MNDIDSDLRDKLEEYGQQHLLAFWPELTSEEQQALRSQIESVDLAMLREIWQKNKTAKQEASSGASRADRAGAPKSVVRQSQSSTDTTGSENATAKGKSLLKANRCAVITVAGGQGTRLGFDKPKGMFPIGPISERTLFQVFAEQIRAIRRHYDCRLKWLIMTSSATHDETRQFFDEHQYFGLPVDSVAFFCQGSLPAMDAESGKLLLSGKGTLSLTPDGHGGLVSALSLSGLLADLAESGVEHLFYHQVDNPTVRICDPTFMGHHALAGSSLTTLVVEKNSPSERMGVLVDLDGHTEIIEYSELTQAQAEKRDDAGQWIFWAGNTAVHAFSRTFLEQLAEGGSRLPLHVARKKVPYVDSTGKLILLADEDEANAFKLERFIFDALPLAETTLIVEGDRDREFNPVKNANGADSPATAQAALSRIGRTMLRAAGQEVDDSAEVEISPLIGMDVEELKANLDSSTVTLADLLRP